ncbi:MAG: pilus assembly protein PilM [Verrucomicrobiales bacterium]|nr:pilus assembly protein PilM [Verrucomicrobiales bacterium]
MADDRIISLNVGAQQIAGAVFSKTAGGGLRLDRIERRDLAGDPGEEAGIADQGATALKEIVSSLKIKGAKTNYVVTSFPVLLKFASLPALDGSQVDQIVEFEAQQQVPYPINEVVWGYQLMGDPDDVEVEVALAAVKSDELTEVDDLITGAGLKSKGAEIAPAALYNALRFNYSDINETTLLVDIGARTTDMIFMEGKKLFIRTVKIGGADITRAIAKEFGTDFVSAERRKISDGFVALGGPYADHEDPEIAAISKVVRNSLTRLHSEIMRTINFYRSQQSGSAPAFVLLSGATSGLPFIREFFAEKLNLPVDHFNPFRNVTVAKGATTEFVGGDAHRYGELIGSALAQIGEVPLRIDLLPESVQKERDLDKRKPALILSLVALAALLIGMGFFFSKGTEIANAKLMEVEGTAADLTKYNKSIEASKDAIATVDGQQEPYVAAVLHRVYWIQVFNYLSQKMKNDLVYLTVLEPMAGGVTIIDDEGATLAEPAAQGESIVDAFSIKGLWRENPGGSKVVYDYFEGLKGEAATSSSNFFDLGEVDISEVLKVDAGTNDDRYAYPFSMILPLPEANRVKFTK